MTIKEMAEILMDRNDDEYLEFERVEQKKSQRPDLHAFLLLDMLVPETSDIVASAAHDEIWLGVEPKTLAAVVTREQLIDLVRCGVRWDDSCESLAMFV
jgi:hypothetical protein